MILEIEGCLSTLIKDYGANYHIFFSVFLNKYLKILKREKHEKNFKRNQYLKILKIC